MHNGNFYSFVYWHWYTVEHIIKEKVDPILAHLVDNGSVFNYDGLNCFKFNLFKLKLTVKQLPVKLKNLIMHQYMAKLRYVFSPTNNFSCRRILFVGTISQFEDISEHSTLEEEAGLELMQLWRVFVASPPVHQMRSLVQDRNVHIENQDSIFFIRAA